ncbi:MAG: ATP-binding cassette domain-containing protein [Pseudonocardiaceae bacterium]|nr:ATP-binding cassette domain-containing protein [Pseudonocardiaceae bacterium]
MLATSGLRARASGHTLLDGIELSIFPGRVLAVLGESGSGKTTLGLALHGEYRHGIELAGSVRLHGTELLGLPDRRRRAARAGVLGHLPQHPATVLNPVRRIGSVLAEYAGLRHRHRSARRTAVAEALHAAQMPAEPWLLRRYPHQLSGGQQQRVALALALITRPEVLVLDEPTTGLDTTTKADVTNMLAGLVGAGTALVLLTHDLALARRLADEVIVLQDGRVIEHGPGTRPLHAPAQPHSRRLLASEPRLLDRPTGARGTRHGVRDLVVRGLGRRATDGTELLADINLVLPGGQCLAIIGRSGAGKTTLARCVAGLTRPGTGQVLLGDVPLAATARQRGPAQRRLVQYVHQDASASFDEYRPVGVQVARTARLLRGMAREDARREAIELCESLGLRADQLLRHPFELSGGQLRRAALARALLARPAVLLCDEITASLDLVNQAELLDVLAHARSTMDISLMLISHDLAAISGIADQICLLQDGRCVETASTYRLLTAPESRGARDLVAAARLGHP